MKLKSLFIFLTLAIQTAWAATITSDVVVQEGYEIKLTVSNLKDLTCYLGYNYGDKKYLQDTAHIATTGESFVFSGDKKLDGGVFFFYTPSNSYFEILVGDEQHFEIKTDTTDFIGKMEVKGSQENILFRDFQIYMRNSQKKAKELSDKLKSDEENKEDYSSQLDKLDKEVKEYRKQLIENNPEKFVATLIKATIDVEVPEDKEALFKNDPLARYVFFKNHFFDNINFHDARLLRSPILQNKINYYLEKLTPSHPDSIAVSAIHIIEKAKANKEVFRYCVVSITNKYETSNIMGMDGVFVKIAEKYYLNGDAYWADEDLVNKIAKKINELKPTLIGSKAPNLNLIDTLGRQVNVQSLKASYIALYFYDPDCGYCKKKTPVLHELYINELKDKNVEVVAVCTVTDQKKWKKFVDENKLSWTNLADPFLRNNFRAEYNIDTTPKLFILNKERKVIAKQLDVEQISEFITKYDENEKM